MGRTVKPHPPAPAPGRRGGVREPDPAAFADSRPLFGIDTMLFVYHFEGNPEFGAAAGRVLAAAEGGRCRLVASALALMEVLVIPKRLGADDLCRKYHEFFRYFPGLTVVPVDEAVAEVAADLRARHAIRTPDAIHLATAIRAGAQAFLTQDLALRRAKEIPVKTLESFRG